MVKGYEYAKGQYVILKDEDFEKIPLEATRALEVAGFVDATEISPLYRERNYYLGPEEISLKPFELFRQALMRTGKVALARAVLWKKEQLVAISPYNGSLVLTTLMYQDEVKPPPEPPRHQADARGEPRDSLRLEGPHLRAEVGRHAGARDRARRTPLSKPPPELRRVPLSGPRRSHAESRHPRRGDRGHERAAAQF